MTKQRLPNSILEGDPTDIKTSWGTLEDHKKELPEHQVVITIKFRHNPDTYSFQISGDSGGEELVNMLEDIRAFVISVNRKADEI